MDCAYIHNSGRTCNVEGNHEDSTCGLYSSIPAVAAGSPFVGLPMFKFGNSCQDASEPLCAEL